MNQPLGRIQPAKRPAGEAGDGGNGGGEGAAGRAAAGPGLPALRKPAGAVGRALSPRYVDFLPESEAVVARSHSPLATVLIAVIGFFFITAIVWASLAEVEQVATGTGQVRPAGRVKVINHPDGGRVSTLYVSEGELVQDGQPLMELDSSRIRSEIDGLTAQWQTLASEVARLEAEATGRTMLEFPTEVVNARPDLVSTQTSLFQARGASLAAQRRMADERIRQARAEAEALRATLNQQEVSMGIMQEQLSAISQLVEKGYFPRLRFLTVQRQVSDLETEVAGNVNQLVVAQARLQSALSERGSIDRQAESEIFEALAQRTAERDRARAQLLAARDRLADTTILATSAGVVQAMQVRASGQAVRPNEPILNIVPLDGDLLIEARVSNDDIGFISIGQQATVKVAAYNFVKHGTLSGHVERISADAEENERTGAVTYGVTIRTDRSYLGAQPGDRPVFPGMQVEVEMKTGDRSIMSYLTDRVISTASDAFQEH